MASPGNQHCATCIGTVSCPILLRRNLDSSTGLSADTHAPPPPSPATTTKLIASVTAAKGHIAPVTQIDPSYSLCGANVQPVVTWAGANVNWGRRGSCIRRRTMRIAHRATQPCIPPGSLNRVPASAGVRAGMSPLPGGR